MASQKIPQTYDPLVTLAGDALDGATTHGAAIGLSQNPAPKIGADLEALVGKPGLPGKQALYNDAKAAKTAATAALRTAQSNARAFCATAIDILRPHLGRQWTSDWQAAGFSGGSLAIPDDVLPLLGELRAYFSVHSPHENGPLGITAASCETQKAAITNARKASNDSNTAAGLAKQARDAAQTTLYRRMSGLLAELGQLLDDKNPLWYAFGFDRPADGESPGPVENLVLTPGGPGMVFADWDDARRADRYRVYKQTPADPEPVEVINNVTESEYTLGGLPSGTAVKIHVIPVNEAGNGPASETVQITVP